MNMTIPEGGINPYAEHPGFTAVCRLRMTINQRDVLGSFHRGGFGCEMTGGHCVPSEHCETRRADADAQDNLHKLCAEAKIRFPGGPR